LATAVFISQKLEFQRCEASCLSARACVSLTADTYRFSTNVSRREFNHAAAFHILALFQHI